MTTNMQTDGLVSGDEHARIHTAHIMSEYLFSLSMMCKHYEWHKTGMHLCAASDELEKMLEANALQQQQYTAPIKPARPLSQKRFTGKK
jgi:hypothetical protein